MTPTLVGRWQTRLALLGTIGLAISAVFAVAVGSLVTAGFWAGLAEENGHFRQGLKASLSRCRYRGPAASGLRERERLRRS